ncbi:MAG: Ldh family oxidoreductase [Ectothiorhodospiraceae bacterium]|nr:Ldh family oxidoreductase [Planctomycetota bacterium]MCP5152426.1 Ldh family oxidoreductase [Chromatiales bacterium]MCP5154274.1 Ldh family oxidoreductase [Ectothiorhodospiraceae bacterium]
MTDTVRVPCDELRALTHAALEAVGVPPADAADAGDVLWRAQMMGITTHGVRRLIPYIQRIHDGAIDPNPTIEHVRKAPSITVIDGGNGLGPVIGSRGTAEAIRLARETGIGYVACRASHHFGPVMPYLLRAVEAGMVCFMGTNVQPVMAPWRGARLAHGNNPIGFGGPRRDGYPFLLDIAISVVAFSKLRHAKEAGEPIPEGWAADSAGRPTTDPVAGMGGWVLPIGGHKGYGLALAVEMLAAGLAGGALGTEVHGLFERGPRAQGVCHFFMAIDPERTIGLDAFRDRMEVLCAMMHDTPAVDPAEPVLVPGEPECALMADCEANGVPLPAQWLDEIRGLARGEMPRSMPEA